MCIKDQEPYKNKDKNAEPKSGTSSLLQGPKSGLKGYVCSLNLQNLVREPKFRTWAYQRQSPCLNQDQNAKPLSGASSIIQTSKSGLRGHEYSLHLQDRA